jgi:hypothetical protein
VLVQATTPDEQRAAKAAITEAALRVLGEVREVLADDPPSERQPRLSSRIS